MTRNNTFIPFNRATKEFYMNKCTQKNWFSFHNITGFMLICLSVLVLMEMPSHRFALTVLIAAAACAGFTFGRGRQNLPSAGKTNQLPHPDAPAHPNAPLGQNQNIGHLRDVLNDVIGIQESADLLERYQYFIKVTEETLKHAVGPCGISLWSPDRNQQSLTECVIRPNRPSGHHFEATLAQAAGSRPPCSVRLDSPVMRQTLRTGRPYLAPLDQSARPDYNPASSPALRCDGCIALYRDYGQPILINIERTEPALNRPEPAAFHAAVELINLFWKQLQFTNQRQWAIEHEPDSRALRYEVFLNQAQDLADKAHHTDELFSLVLIAVQGFRSMFGDNSRQWRLLSGLFGQCLGNILTQNNEQFVLGKLADDIFALMLPRSDSFLAQAVMKALVARLGDEMSGSKAAENLDVIALDLRWIVADHRQYYGSMEQLLEKIYRRLFSREADKDQHLQRIVLGAAVAEAIAQT